NTPARKKYHTPQRNQRVLATRSIASLYSLFSSNATAPTEIYTLSLHDALPISSPMWRGSKRPKRSSSRWSIFSRTRRSTRAWVRSEEHTSELQSPYDLVCRLLLEKKNNTTCVSQCMLCPRARHPKHRKLITSST